MHKFNNIFETLNQRVRGRLQDEPFEAEGLFLVSSNLLFCVCIYLENLSVAHILKQ